MEVEKRLAPGEQRFVARPRRTKRRSVWEVYDRARGSYPRQVPKFGEVKRSPTEEACEAEADRLAEFYKEKHV